MTTAVDFSSHFSNEFAAEPAADVSIHFTLHGADFSLFALVSLGLSFRVQRDE